MVEKSAQAVAVILAAGKSQRFGSPKMQYRFSDGRTMLQHTCAIYADIFSKVVVVLRSDDELNYERLRVEYDESQLILMSLPNSQALSESLTKAVRYASTLMNNDAKGCLIALGDMPNVQRKTIEQMQCEFGDAALVRPSLITEQGASVGNPVFIGRRFLPELVEVTGDVGARPLLKKYSSSVRYVEVKDHGVVTDFDVPPSAT